MDPYDGAIYPGARPGGRRARPVLQPPGGSPTYRQPVARRRQRGRAPDLYDGSEDGDDPLDQEPLSYAQQYPSVLPCALFSAY